MTEHAHRNIISDTAHAEFLTQECQGQISTNKINNQCLARPHNGHHISFHPQLKKNILNGIPKFDIIRDNK